MSIAEVRNQISITKVYNLHDRLIQFIVINLLIDHLGRPRIDWNSDVEPRPKPPNRSWAPAIENQGNKYVISAVCMLSNYVVAKAIPSKHASNVVNFLVDDVICKVTHGSWYENIEY